MSKNITIHLKTNNDLQASRIDHSKKLKNFISAHFKRHIYVISLGAAITDNKFATISTAGKIANSATTTTNTKIANTTIARDELGDFAANTAILVGNLNLLSSISSSIGNVVKEGISFIHNSGTNNTCVGINAGNFTTSGVGNNSCFGVNALTLNTTGANNTAIGYNALPLCTTGSNNIAIGANAASLITTGNNNIHIAHNALSATENATTRIGTPGTQIQCFIAGIRGITTGSTNTLSVLIDSNGQLGTIASSQQVKHDIKDMGIASDEILKLRPVTFVYNTDTTETMQYGLIAEEVEEVFPAIVVKNEQGQPETVQYHVLPVLLLNELKKQQDKINSLVTIEAMNNAISDLQMQIQQLVARINN